MCADAHVCVWYMYVHVMYTNACVWCTQLYYSGERYVNCAQVAVLGHSWVCLSICVRSWEVGTQVLVKSIFTGAAEVGEQFAHPQS